jgi:pimeloyl-ACP methyl ester carboxylesterase
MATEEVTLSVPGLTLAARVHGPSDGPPILALHGWLDNAASFDHLAPHLSSHRLYAVDMAGHGLSQHRSADGNYDVIHAAAELQHAANALGLPERFILMGHSLGAAISALFAGAFSDRVEKLVLLEGLGPLTETETGAPGRLASAVRDEKRGSETRVFSSIEDAAERVVSSVGMKLDSALTLVRRGLKAERGGYAWRTDSRLRAPSRLRLTEGQVEGFMRAIKAPVLAVLASSGWPVPKEAIETRLSYLRHKEVVRVEGGHHVHLDAPERIADRLRAFLGDGRYVSSV